MRTVPGQQMLTAPDFSGAASDSYVHARSPAGQRTAAPMRRGPDAQR